MSDFYVGYDPKPPARLMRFVRRVVVGVIALGVALAILFVLVQQPFPAAYFDFGHKGIFLGEVSTTPYPSLFQGHFDPVGHLTGYDRYLLVAPGKHGAESLVAGWDNRTAFVRGTLIHRDGQSMIEVSEPLDSAIAIISHLEPGAPTDEPESHIQLSISLGHVTLTGEIVDSKCYLGVMNPGQGKVHRDCAARCISGGIPPALLTSSISSQPEVVLLTDATGHAPTGQDRDRILHYVGEPVQLSGELRRTGQTLTLQADLHGLRAFPSGLVRR